MDNSKQLRIISKALLFFSLFLVAKLQLSAQTAESRSIISSFNNSSRLTGVAERLKNLHSLDEQKVRDYLAAHPGLPRIFERNGSTWFLQRIGSDGNPLYINTKNLNSGQLIKANQLYSGGSLGVNFTGTGMVAGIWDGGQVRATHDLLSSHVTMQAGQTINTTGGNNHMCHVSGTIVGKKIVSKPEAQGIAYDATAQNYDWDNDKAEMTAFAVAGYLISNHSYGLSNDNTVPVWQFGAYDNEARSWDEVTKNAPFYLPFVAAGNEQQSNGNMTKVGYDLITGSSAAKNVVTVGAVNGDKTMSDYSNWGPADDGRFKPEIVARGTDITSSYSTADNAYNTGSGTSYATPAVAATSLLLQQYYFSLNNAYLPSAALKALLLHTAEDLGNAGPDYKFGWGLVNAEKAALVIRGAANPKTSNQNRGAMIVTRTDNPANNSSSEISFDVVAKGGEPLVISMAWLDDEGVEQTSGDGTDPTTGRLVYNFDMMVRNLSVFTDTRPWKPMGMSNRTTNATLQTAWFGTDNNNYRQVYIGTPTADVTYRIYIRKSSSSPAAARNIYFIVTGARTTAPTFSASQNYCGGAILKEIPSSNNTINLKWYDAASGGNLLPSNTAMVNGGTYYGSQTGYNESARTAVTVSVNAVTPVLPTTATSITGSQTRYTRYISPACATLIASLEQSGNLPVAGNTSAKVWIETTQNKTFVKRHYEVTPLGNASTATGTVILYFKQSEFDDYNAVNSAKLPQTPTDAAGKTNLLIDKYSGTGGGTGLPGTYSGSPSTINPDDANIVWNAANNWWEVTFDVTGFSGFFVRTISGVLPVNWFSVNANLNTQKQAVITWKVQEAEVAGYTVERSRDGINFQPVTTLSSKGNGINDYSLTDPSITEGVLYYRIRRTDIDGKISYSSIVRVGNQSGSEIFVYPNPVNDRLNIETNLRRGSIISLTDINGKLLQQIRVTTSNTGVDMKNYSSGLYFLKTEEGTVIKIVKQ